MKFQFSIARLLWATAMVALTFGVARLLLDKAISTYAIAVAVFAADFGLLVLIAQKKSDLYLILRAILLTFGSLILIVFTTGLLTILMEQDALHPISKEWPRLLVIFLIGISLLFLWQLLSRRIGKNENQEIIQRGEEADVSNEVKDK
jgi:hypothetical protein